MGGPWRESRGRPVAAWHHGTALPSNGCGRKRHVSKRKRARLNDRDAHMGGKHKRGMRGAMDGSTRVNEQEQMKGNPTKARERLRCFDNKHPGNSLCFQEGMRLCLMHLFRQHCLERRTCDARHNSFQLWPSALPALGTSQGMSFLQLHVKAFTRARHVGVHMR